MTTAPERYYGDWDRGNADYEEHRVHIASVLLDVVGVTDTVARDIAMQVITADTFPRTGLDPNFARALDDIFALRRAAAYEARVIEAHYEGVVSFPKSRLAIAQNSVEGLRQVARGNYMAPYRAVPRVRTEDGFTVDGMKAAFEALGLSSNLTNWQYEQERPLLIESVEARAARIRAVLDEAGIGSATDREAAALRIAALPESKPSRAYSEAVTEIYSIRGLFAVEARLMDAHLAMKTFPKSRRSFAGEQARGFAALAAGKTVRHGSSGMSLASAGRDAGMSPTLSRAEFETAAANGLWGLSVGD